VLSLAHVPQPDVFRAIVVRIDFVPTLQTLKLLTFAVVFMGEATVSVRTPLARMVWFDLLNRDTAFWCFVLDVLDESTECPDMMPVSVRQSLSNIRQILKHDYVAVVDNRFLYDLVGDRVDVLFPPCSLSLSKPQQGVVSGLGAALLHLCAAFFKLLYPVVVLVTAPERASAGDGEAVHTEVDTEDCLVLGIVRILDFNSVTVFVHVSRFDVEVELVGRLVVLECTRPKLIVFRENVFLIWCWTVCWQLKVTFDPSAHRRKRDFVPVKRGTALVVDHAPRGKFRFVRPFVVLPAVNAAIDGVDSTSNGFLNEIRCQVCFLAETVVQRISGCHVRGDTVVVVGVVPAVVTGLVRTVEELLGGFVEVVVVLVGNDNFDRRGASDLHISAIVLTVFEIMGVGRLWSRGLRHTVSASSPAYSRRASDQSDLLAFSSGAVRGAPRREFKAVKPPRKARSDDQRDRRSRTT